MTLGIRIGLYHPLKGITKHNYKFLCLYTTIFCKEKALAFNSDRCCHQVLCLQMIILHRMLLCWVSRFPIVMLNVILVNAECRGSLTGSNTLAYSSGVAVTKKKKIKFLRDSIIDIESLQNRLLKVCYVPASSASPLKGKILLFFSFFCCCAIDSTNAANKVT